MKDLLCKKRFVFPLVIFVTVLVFWPTLFSGFVKNDDPYHLLENTTIRALTWENIKAMFFDIINTTYLPLTSLSFAIEYYFFGYQPWIYHLNNLLLHLGVTVMVYLFLIQLGLSRLATGIATLFFAIHPMRVESVAWITERKDVLYAFFYMAGLLCYGKYIKENKTWAYGFSLGFCALSVLAKSMAISFPLILLLWDWWEGRKWTFKILLEKIPFFLAVALIAGITYAWNVRNPVHAWLEAPMLWIWCFVFYPLKYLCPWSLCVFYQFPKPISWGNIQYVGAMLIFILILACVWRWRRHRWIVFAFCFYVLSIFFLLRMDDLPNINPVSERFIYLPGLGLSMLMALGFTYGIGMQSRPSIKKMSYVLLLVFTIFYVGKTYSQCLAWKDPARLWSEVIRRSPDLAMAYVHRGSELHFKGDLSGAIADYQKAIQLKDDPYAHSNMGMIYKEQEQWQKAQEAYDQAIALKKDFWGAYFDRGNLNREQQRWREAIVDYSQAIKFHPGYSEAYGNRGLAYFHIQQEQAAFLDFTRAILYDPYNVNAINNRAVLYAMKGHQKEAIADFTRLIKLDANNSAFYFNRGLAYKEIGERQFAVNDFTQAVKMKTDYQEARQQLDLLTQ